MLKTSEKFWRILNNISNRMKQENQFPHQLDIINKSSYTNPIEIVNKLNIHFTNIGLQTFIKK